MPKKKCDQCGKKKESVKKYHYIGVVGGEMDWFLCDKCIKTWKVEKKVKRNIRRRLNEI